MRPRIHLAHPLPPMRLTPPPPPPPPPPIPIIIDDDNEPPPAYIRAQDCRPTIEWFDDMHEYNHYCEYQAFLPSLSSMNLFPSDGALLPGPPLVGPGGRPVGPILIRRSAEDTEREEDRQERHDLETLLFEVRDTEPDNHLLAFYPHLRPRGIAPPTPPVVLVDLASRGPVCLPLAVVDTSLTAKMRERAESRKGPREPSVLVPRAVRRRSPSPDFFVAGGRGGTGGPFRHQAALGPPPPPAGPPPGPAPGPVKPAGPSKPIGPGETQHRQLAPQAPRATDPATVEAAFVAAAVRSGRNALAALPRLAPKPPVVAGTSSSSSSGEEAGMKLRQVKLPHIGMPYNNLCQAHLPQAEVPHVQQRPPPVVEDLGSVELPPLQLSRFQVPHVRLPQVKLPQSQLPHQLQLPHVELPHVELPPIQLSHLEMSQLRLPPLRLPQVPLPRATLPQVTVPEPEASPQPGEPKGKQPQVQAPQVKEPKGKEPEEKVGDVIYVKTEPMDVDMSDDDYHPKQAVRPKRGNKSVKAGRVTKNSSKSRAPASPKTTKPCRKSPRLGAAVEQQLQQQQQRQANLPCAEPECTLPPRPSHIPRVREWCGSGYMFICHVGDCGREQKVHPLTRRSLLDKLMSDDGAEPVPLVTRLRKTFAEHVATRHGIRMTPEQMDHFLVDSSDENKENQDPYVVPLWAGNSSWL